MADTMQFPPALAGPGFFVANEDNLRLTVYNALAGVRVTVAGRHLAVGSERPQAFVREFTPASDRTASTFLVRLEAGWLLNLQIYASNGAPLIGQTFAIASIVRGSTGFVEDLATLAAGYVTAKQRAAWPNAPISNSLDGQGALRQITGTNPGAGNEVNEVVPTGARWQLLTFSMTLTTSAVAGNRDPFLVVDDGTDTLFQIGQGLVTAASTTRRQYWATGLGGNATGFAASAIQGLPTTHLLLPGQRLRTSTTAWDVGDAWTLIKYVVREWLEGA